MFIGSTLPLHIAGPKMYCWCGSERSIASVQSVLASPYDMNVYASSYLSRMVLLLGLVSPNKSHKI